MRSALLLFLMSIAAILPIAGLTGCRRAPGAVEAPARNATPKDALLQLLHAMQEANPDKIAVACKAKPEARPVIEAGASYTREVYRFRDLFIAQYGKEAWETFQDPAHRPGDHDTTFVIMTNEAMDRASKTEFEMAGDKASCMMPIGQGRVTLLKNSDGTWIADGAIFIPPGHTAQDMKKTLDSLTALVKKYEKAIGKPNIGAGDIDYELGREIDELVTNGEWKDTSKHRFEVDKL